MYLSFQLANVTMSIFPEKTSLDRAEVSVSLALTPRFFLNWNHGVTSLFLRENFREVSPGGVLSFKDGWRRGFGSCSGPDLRGVVVNERLVRDFTTHTVLYYPRITPKWPFLVGKPIVVGYHHFRKHPPSFSRMEKSPPGFIFQCL